MAGPAFGPSTEPNTGLCVPAKAGDPSPVEVDILWQVVYTRDGVAVWPTRKQRITGRLSLIKQNSVLFFAWLPYSQGMLDAETSAEPLKDAADVASIPVSQGVSQGTFPLFSSRAQKPSGTSQAAGFA